MVHYTAYIYENGHLFKEHFKYERRAQQAVEAAKARGCIAFYNKSFPF